MQKKQYKSFILTVLGFMLILMVPICGNWLYLHNYHEFDEVETIASKQLNSEMPALVGFGTREQGHYYKLSLIKEAQPEVLVLGSSRVMQIRQSFFNTSMITAGGAMSSINEGHSLIRDVLNVYKPKVILIGLDYWWFNDKALAPTTEIKGPRKLSHNISLKTYLLPFEWLYEKKVPVKDYLSKLNPLYLWRTDAQPGYGIDAMLNKTGYAKDGSYFYTKTISGQSPSLDEKFEMSLSQLEQGGLRFEPGQAVHPTHFKNFINMLREIQLANVPVVLFFPPNAPTVVSAMKSQHSQFAFIDDLKVKLIESGLAFYDFHDPSIIEATDCEFIDGIHGGELTYAKLMQYIAQSDIEQVIKPFINQTYLQEVTSKYHDISMLPHPEISSNPEVDFLKLGCDKSSYLG